MTDILWLMHLLYVDESGDAGMTGSPTRHFCLSALSVHEFKWKETLEKVIAFRREVKARYGLKLREEIHASDFMQRPGDLARIERWKRLKLLRDVLDFEATLTASRLINVVVHKDGKTADADIFSIAWTTLIQRFEMTLKHRNFPSPPGRRDLGIIITDHTDGNRLSSVIRKMRRFNPVPSRMRAGEYRDMPLTSVVEDAFSRDSRHSYFIQLVDVSAYFLKQKYSPNNFILDKGARNYFDRLKAVTLSAASRRNSLGIVER